MKTQNSLIMAESAKSTTLPEESHRERAELMRISQGRNELTSHQADGQTREEDAALRTCTDQRSNTPQLVCNTHR